MTSLCKLVTVTQLSWSLQGQPIDQLKLVTVTRVFLSVYGNLFLHPAWIVQFPKQIKFLRAFMYLILFNNSAPTAFFCFFGFPFALLLFLTLFVQRPRALTARMVAPLRQAAPCVNCSIESKTRRDYENSYSDRRKYS